MYSRVQKLPRVCGGSYTGSAAADTMTSAQGSRYDLQVVDTTIAFRVYRSKVQGGVVYYYLDVVQRILLIAIHKFIYLCHSYLLNFYQVFLTLHKFVHIYPASVVGLSINMRPAAVSLHWEGPHVDASNFELLIGMPLTLRLSLPLPFHRLIPPIALQWVAKNCIVFAQYISRGGFHSLPPKSNQLQRQSLPAVSQSVS